MDQMWNQWPGIILIGFSQYEENMAVKACDVYIGGGVGSAVGGRHRGRD